MGVFIKGGCMKKIYLFSVSTSVFLAVFIFTALMFSQAELGAKELPVPMDSKEMQKMREYHIKGDIDNAIKEAQAYLKTNSSSIEAMVRLAECYASKGELITAEEWAKKALLSSNDKDLWALRAMAEIYRRQFGESKDMNSKKKYMDLAISAIGKALIISPNDAWVNWEAANIYFSSNDKVKAKEAIEFALAGEPKNEFFLKMKEAILLMK
jgi:tetratricopeptide (TPR) repeat protein